MQVQVELTDLVPPESYTIRGGAAGFAKGAASLKLIEEEGGTRLFYDVDTNVGGKLAQVGSRLIDGAARKIADGFFSKFAQTMVPKYLAQQINNSFVHGGGCVFCAHESQPIPFHTSPQPSPAHPQMYGNALGAHSRF